MDTTSFSEIQVAVNSLEQSHYEKNNDWEALLGKAREIMASVGTSSLFEDPTSREQQIYIIEVLQGLAYHDVDAGGVADLAEWCLERWLHLHQVYPDDLAISRGESYTVRLKTPFDMLQESDSGGYQGPSHVCREFMPLTAAFHRQTKAIEQDTGVIQRAFEAVWMRNEQNWRHKCLTAPKRQSKDFIQLIMLRLEVFYFRQWITSDRRSIEPLLKTP